MLFTEGQSVGQKTTQSKGADKPAAYRYFFPNAPIFNHDATSFERLDALADAMMQMDETAELKNSKNAPVLTFFGTFIEHDISAMSGQITGDHPNKKPLPRPVIEKTFENLRSGFLDLDSIYGATNQTDFGTKLSKLMRHPTLKGKMRVASTEHAAKPQNLGQHEQPTHHASDNLRLVQLLDSNEIKANDLATLPDSLKSLFLKDLPNGETAPNPLRAILGDDRNDQSLCISQFHLAWLRFHNRVVDACDDPIILKGSSDVMFSWARTRVRWHYQWLMVNAYLQNLCQQDVLDSVLKKSAPLYAKFLKEGPEQDGTKAPLPLEFTLAAFRFGHAMARPTYDWNMFFTKVTPDQLRCFTGCTKNPMQGLTQRALPSNWSADWSRLVFSPTEQLPHRAALKITTSISASCSPAKGNNSRAIDNKARAILHDGHVHNLPSGQDCIEDIRTTTGVKLHKLTARQLSEGRVGDAVLKAGFEKETPLWFYILKEAEALNDGESLGPLGSYLVANTLVGLLVNDPYSYWNQPGSDNGRWHPDDSVRPCDESVDSIPALMRAALLME